MVDPSELVVYEGSSDWSALYHQGGLVEVGDAYLIQDRLLELLEVKTIHSDDFMRGGFTRDDVARTLDEIHEYLAVGSLAEVEVAVADELEAGAAALQSAQERLDLARSRASELKR